MKLLNGMYSAIFSVYDKQLKVKKNTVKELVNYHLDNGLKGFYVCGNTGECKVLPVKTRKEMLEAVVDENNGRGQVVAHIGAGLYNDSLELLEHANSLNVDAVASLPPALQAYYGSEDVLTYYKTLAEKSKVPVYAYITRDLATDYVTFVEKLSKIDNIIGVKLSVPDYYVFGKISAKFGDKLNIINGPDETCLCGLTLGADGAIGTTYNILPKVASKLYDSFIKGDINSARELQRTMNTVVIDKLVSYDGIAYWKAVLTCMGFDMGHTVEPEKLPTQEEIGQMTKMLKQSGLFEII